MTLYLVFFSCLATIAIATWKILNLWFNFLYSKWYVKNNETHPREKGFVLWGHFQNILDDPRKTRKDTKFYITKQGPKTKSHEQWEQQ